MHSRSNPARQSHRQDRVELSLALTGDDAALERLVGRLLPVVQARVARTLLRYHGGNPPESLRQVVEDAIQEVFLRLFEDDSRALRGWQPERGLSLDNFVGLLAERRVLAILRSARQNPWTEVTAEPATLDSRSRQAGPETTAASREGLEILLARFKEELSPLGWRVFELLFLFERTVQEVGRETCLSAAAVYAWRSRLRRRARGLFEEMEVPTPRTG